jgi:hypothetical protein
MTRRVGTWVALTAALILTTGALADDLGDADSLLCSTGQAVVCSVEGICESAPSWILDIPQFIIVDLKARTLSTTPASGENRSTPVKNMERADGMILVQGIENGRAFSILIDERTGALTAAVARDSLTVSVFGACTPELQ